MKHQGFFDISFQTKKQLWHPIPQTNFTSKLRSLKYLAVRMESFSIKAYDFIIHAAMSSDLKFLSHVAIPKNGWFQL